MNWTLVVVGLCIAFAPLSLIVFFVLLTTRRGLVNGAAFIMGWMSCLVVIEVVTLVFTQGRPPRQSTTPGTLVDVGFIVVGIVGLAVIVSGCWWMYLYVFVMLWVVLAVYSPY